MKLLSIAVPCYNSEAYMENCIKSLLVGGDEVEILIVDDGSGDGTAQIADRLEREHPGIVRAIHQPNKGHGGAVNTGIENATGLYFKVVDSDDKVRASAYKSILDVLRRFSGEEEYFAANFPSSESFVESIPSMNEDQNTEVKKSASADLDLKNIVIVLILLLLGVEWIAYLRK